MSQNTKLSRNLLSLPVDIEEDGLSSEYFEVYDIKEIYSKGTYVVTLRGSSKLKRFSYIYLDLLDEKGQAIPINVATVNDFENKFLPLRRISFQITDIQFNGVGRFVFYGTTTEGNTVRWVKKFLINKALPAQPINERGDWTAQGEWYDIGDVVQFNGASYISILGHQPDGIDPTYPTYWKVFASSGYTINLSKDTLLIPFSTSNVVDLDGANSTVTILQGNQDVTSNFTIDVTRTQGDAVFTFDQNVIKIWVVTQNVQSTLLIEAQEIGGTVSIQKELSVRTINSGIQGEIGLSLLFRGEWDATTTYETTNISTDVVLKVVGGNEVYYYLAEGTGTSINEDPESGGSPWITFQTSYESIATDILLAKDVTIRRTLTMGDATKEDEYGATGVIRSLGGFDVNGETTLTQSAIVTRYYNIDPNGIFAYKGIIGGISMEQDKLFIGTGTYNNSNTPFYVDNMGQFSLSDKLSWNGTLLNISGSIQTDSGSIGGWDINEDNINSNNVFISSENNLSGLYVTDNNINRLQVGKFPVSPKTSPNLFSIGGNSLSSGTSVATGNHFVSFTINANNSDSYQDLPIGTISVEDTIGFSGIFEKAFIFSSAYVEPTELSLSVQLFANNGSTELVGATTLVDFRTQYTFEKSRTFTFYNDTASQLNNVIARVRLVRTGGNITTINSAPPVFTLKNINITSTKAIVNITDEQLLIFSSVDNYLEWTKEKLDIKTSTFKTNTLETGNLTVLGDTTLLGNVTVEGELSSHPVTDAIPSTTNSAETVIQNLSFDQFGHVVGQSSLDLDAVFFKKTGGTISGNVTMTNDLTVQGSVTVLGSYFSASVEHVKVKDNLLTINDGETGSGITAGFAGIEIDRGTANDFWFVFEEARQRFVVGLFNNLQVVATREDNPISNGVGFFNSSTNRTETASGFTFESNVLSTPSNISLGAQATNTSHAVRADRTITINSDNGITGGSATAENLTGNLSWTFGLTGRALRFHDLSTDGFVVQDGATIKTKNILGTTDRVTITNGTSTGGDVTVDIASTYVGQSSINTLGTVTTGTWNASLITPTYGGTGRDSLDQNKILVGNGTNNVLTPTNLHWDSVNNRLGINQVTPQYSVDVSGTFRLFNGDNDAILYTDGNAGQTGGWIDRRYNVGLITNSSQWLDNFGNVGIRLQGTSSNEGSIITENFIGSTTSLMGAFGVGWKVWRDSEDLQSYMELDNLFVRNTLRAHIFQKDIVRASNGYLFISDADEITETVSVPVSSQTFDFYTKEGVFQPDDLVWYKDIDETNGGLEVTGVRLKILTNPTQVTREDQTVNRYTALVISQGGTNATLRTGGTAVRVGNESQKGRDGSIYFDASSTSSPYMDVYAQVDSWESFQSIDKVKVRLGKLSGVTSKNYGQLSGYGLWTNNVYLEGNASVAGSLTAGDENGVGNTFYAGRIRKNILKSSNQIGNNDWIQNNASIITLNNSLSPNGLTEATTVNFTGIGTQYIYQEIPVEIGKPYVFSVYAKIVSGSIDPNKENISFGFDSDSLTDASTQLSNEWKRFTTYIDSAESTTASVFISGNNAGLEIAVWGAQFEQGTNVTPLQTTDNTLSQSNGYGMWAIQGGFGGTIQAPVVELGSYGMRVVNNGTEQQLLNNSIFIGNISGSATSSIALTNTGTNSTSGLYGYTNNGYVSFALRLDGTSTIAGFNFNDNIIYSGDNTFGGSGLYLNSANNQFSLGNKLLFNGTDLSIEGNFTASAGSIGGWDITANTIEKGNVTLNSLNEFIRLGNNVTVNSGTGIFLSGSGDFGFNKDTNNYVRGIGNELQIRSTNARINAGNLDLDSTTERFRLGTTTTFGSGNGILIGKDGANYRFYAGNALNYIDWNGTSLNISGSINSTDGNIGGWVIGQNSIASGNISLNSVNGIISLGNSPTMNSGDGVFLSGSGDFRFGSNTSNVKFDNEIFTVTTPKFSIDENGDVQATNLRLSGNSKSDLVYWNTLVINSSNQATYIKTVTVESQTFTYLDLSTATAGNFVRLEVAPTHPIGFIKPPINATDESVSIIIETSQSNVRFHAFDPNWNSLPSPLLNNNKIVYDPKDWASRLFQPSSTTTESLGQFEATTGVRYEFVGNSRDFKIQSASAFERMQLQDVWVGTIHADNIVAISQSIDIDFEALNISGTPSRVVVFDGTGTLTESVITTTELGYLDDVTSNIQTQLNAKQPTITGGATTLTSSNLTVNRALISDANGKVVVSDITTTELGYLDGVTSGIQSQIDGKVPNERTITLQSENGITGGSSTAFDLSTNRSWTFGLTGRALRFHQLATNGFVVQDGATVKTKLIGGTTNRIDVTNGGATNGDVSVNISPNYVGQTSITTLGTITTGTWNGSTIAVNRGGTGQTTYTDGQLLIGNSSNNSLSKATLTGTTNRISITNGNGSITISAPQDIHTTATPTFNQLSLNNEGTGTSNAVRADRSITLNSDTNVTISDSGTARNLTTNRTWSLGWNGQLSVPRGGTGTNSLTSNKILVGNGTDAITAPTNLHWDSVNNRLGINQVTPQYSVDVNGTFRLFNGDGDAILYTDGNNSDRGGWIDRRYDVGLIVSSDQWIENYNNVGLRLTGTQGNQGAIITQNYIGSSESSLGAFGTGWKLYTDAVDSQTYLEIDNISVRNTLRSHIFQKDIVRASNGYLLISDADEIVSDVQLPISATQEFTIYTKDGTLQSGDITWYKDIANQGDSLNINGFRILIVSQAQQDVINEQDVYRYTAKMLSGFANNSFLRSGGTIVRIGNQNNTSRQGALYFDASSNASPYMDVYDGVDSEQTFQTQNKIKSRLGNLSGIVSPTAGQLTGYGLWTNNVYLEGNASVAGTITAGDEDGFGSTFYAGRINKNLLKSSNQVGNNDWIKNSTNNITLNNAVAPNNKMEATTVIFDTYNPQYIYQQIPVQIGNPYVFSVYAKIVSGSIDSNVDNFSIGFTSDSLTDATPELSTQWKRFVSYVESAESTTASIFISGNNPSIEIALWGAQFEKSSTVTPLQPTDTNISNSSTNDYGMWAIQGGFGGTIQAPVVELGSYGLRVINNGTSKQLEDNSIFIGNISGSASGSIALTNTGTNSTSGLYGYTNNGDVSFALRLDGTSTIGGFDFDNTTISSGDNTFAGTGLYLNSSTNEFSLGNKLTFNGTDLSIEGSFTSSAGSIGGWDITTNTIEKGNVEFNSQNETIKLGSTSTFGSGTGVLIGKDGANYRFYAGNGTQYIDWTGTQLNISGSINSTSGNIGGWSIGNNTLSSGNVNLNSNTQVISLGNSPTISSGDGIYMSGSGDFRFGTDTNNITSQSNDFSITTPNFSVDTSGNVQATNLRLNGNAKSDLVYWNTLIINSGNQSTYFKTVTALSSTFTYLDLSTATAGNFVRIEVAPVHPIGFIKAPINATDESVSIIIESSVSGVIFHAFDPNWNGLNLTVPALPNNTKIVYDPKDWASRLFEDISTTTESLGQFEATTGVRYQFVGNSKDFKIQTASAFERMQLQDVYVGTIHADNIVALTQSIAVDLGALNISSSANTVAIFNNDGILSTSPVTPTELGHLDGVTSGIQSQIDGKVPNERTITLNTNNGITGGSAIASDLSANRSWTFGLTGRALRFNDLSTNGFVVQDGSTIKTKVIGGTTNRISVTNGGATNGDVSIDIASTYVGQTSITTLGTITTGTVPWARLTNYPTFTINGTANRISVDNSAQTLQSNRTWNITTPQDIHTGANFTASTLRANTGFTFNGTASEGEFLRGNGTHFVPSNIQSQDIEQAYNFSDNSVLFWNQNQLQSDSQNLNWNSTTKRFGINKSNPEETLHIVGNVRVEGQIYADVKHFRIKDKQNPDQTITYTSLEGNSNDVFIKGKVKSNKNKFVIELPKEWLWLIDEESVNVQLTSIGHHQKLIVSDISNNTVTIKNRNLFFGRKINCSYIITATRKDIPKLEVYS